MENIFLSRPSYIPEEYKAGFDNLLRLLEASNLAPRTIGSTDYPTNSPMQEVVELMKKCSGAIILGIPQITIISGKMKDLNITTEVQLGTEWNHIEAAIAYTLNKNIFIINLSI